MRATYLNFFLPVLSFAVLAFSHAANAADRQTGLRFVVQSKIEATKSLVDKSGKETTANYQTVTIFPEKVSIKDKRTETIYDLRHKKVIILNLGAKTFFVTSLYAVPGFNMAEKANRAALTQSLLANSAAPKDVPDAFDLDMQFGGKYRPQDVEGLLSGGDPTKKSYQFRGEDIAAYELTATEIPGSLRKAYGNYLAYAMTAHPVIRNDLQATGKAFGSLRLTNRDIAPALTDKYYTTSLMKVISEEPPNVPAGYKPGLAGKDALVQILTAKPVTTAPAELAAIKQLYTDKQYTDAAIAFLGYTAAYGSSGIEELKPVLAGLTKEAPPESRVKEILGLCSAQPSPQSAGQVVQFLKQLQATKPQQAHNLAGCLGLYQQTAGQLNDAQMTRMAALLRNPGLVGVMKDLGDGFYGQYDTFAAWALWDRARALNPAHPATRDITVLEQHIIKDMPDFF